MKSPSAIARKDMVECGRSLYRRGYAFGTAGNISLRLEERIFVSPSNRSLGALTPKTIAEVDREGHAVGGRPSKESHVHLAVYRVRPEATAVVHLHSTYATAAACLRELPEDDALPVFTPYYAMRVPRLPVVPFFVPGAAELAAEVEKRIGVSPALLLRNHGLLAAGKTLAEASALAEEVEEAAKLYFLLQRRGLPLTSEQIAACRGRSRP